MTMMLHLGLGLVALQSGGLELLGLQHKNCVNVFM